MAFDIKTEAREHYLKERQARMVREYAVTKSKLGGAKKALKDAEKQVESLEALLKKLETEAEKDIGDEWEPEKEGKKEEPH